MMTDPDDNPIFEPRAVRRAVAIAAGLNFGYFWVQVVVALAIGSVALFADSVDFLEDTAVNLLIFVALGWPLARRALAGRVMAAIILVPSVAAAWMAFVRAQNPEPPDVLSLVVTAGGAMLVNAICALVLSRIRAHGGSLTAAAFLSARNDVLVNLTIIAMAFVTAWTASGWPDIVLGIVILVLNATAAKEVWEVATEERLAAKALADEEIDDD
ncbi:cation transporter [Mobilicoccus massiliensis]|uniref:cation transporter n=2 Tax=Mobilicoccus massiliensis TaxID=1522310 RepID=UPI000B020FF3|nr:cation transporter [Mobilicoccus massiliensis]